MGKPFFRNWDNSNKFIKASWQANIAKIGHVEFLYDYLNENSLPNWEQLEDGYNIGEVVFATDGIYRNTVENNTNEPPNNGWELLANVSVPYSPPYKVYTALLTQSGINNAPTANVLQNTLGGNITFSYTSVGNYKVISSGLFTLNKTTVFTGQNYGGTLDTNTYANLAGVNEIIIETAAGGVEEDDNLVDTFIEIRVYE